MFNETKSTEIINSLEDYILQNSSLILTDVELYLKLKDGGVEQTLITSVAMHEYMKKLNEVQ